MSIDTRINDILNEYENEWDDSLIEVIQESFPQQICQYISNYTTRLEKVDASMLDMNFKLGSKDDVIFKEYKTIGFYIIWISLLRTLDISVTYMLLQRTSILFSQYIIVYIQARQNNSQIDFSLKELISYILKNLLGAITVPIQTNIDDKKRMKLWSTLVKLYSKFTVEYE